ncbi:hypothetical protein [Fluviispira multicolorata]|uniref:Lipoprotein n=1 Tax=Fluviispira multicolorata TaxID=2654512 RepID=A0A833JCB5_9BACT|nr:hypothetical protein [Fluviispira multicolorata]KAB8030643.1 hypothetical protein GCL57_06620 [Fluviispira multicolorata]
MLISSFKKGIINSIILIFFILSCTKKTGRNILSRNENGYEIPQDILIYNEQPSSSVPHYFKMATFELHWDDGKLKYSKNMTRSGFSTEKNLQVFNDEFPGIPIKIISPENVPNSDYNISFKTDFNIISCRGLLVKLSKKSDFIIVNSLNVSPKESCIVLITVSTPDKLNKISRNLVLTWNKGNSYWCENSSYLNFELHQFLGRTSCQQKQKQRRFSFPNEKCYF